MITEFVISLALSAIAVALAIISVFAARHFYAVAIGHPRWLIPGLFWVIAFAKIFSVGLSGRDLSHLNVPDSIGLPPASMEAERGGALYTNVLRLCTLLFLALPLVQIIYSRSVRTASSINALFWGYSVFFMGNFVLNAIFGSHPALIVQNIYFAVGVLGVLSVRSVDIPLVVHHAKLAAFVVVVLSLVMLFVQPSLVAETGYRGIIPGLDIRLHGLTSNANAMGPICLAVILVEVAIPEENKVASWAILLVSVAALVLSQSKTTWVAGLLALFFPFAIRVASRVLSDIHLGVIRPTVAVAVVTTLAAAGLLGVLLALGDVSFGASLLSSRESAELTSLTGRDAIWKVALIQWDKNPLFGYGPELWNDEFRRQIGMWFAFSAHNEYIQSLSRAGMVGLITLVVYVCVIGWYSVVKMNDTNGLSLMLFVVVLVRNISETPLSHTTFASVEAFTHLLLLSVLCWPTTSRGTDDSSMNAQAKAIANKSALHSTNPLQ